MWHEVTLLQSPSTKKSPLFSCCPRLREPPTRINTRIQRIRSPDSFPLFAHQVTGLQSDSLWGGKRLHHMDIISFSGGSAAPESGGAPMPSVKMGEGNEFAVSWGMMIVRLVWCVCGCGIVV